MSAAPPKRIPDWALEGGEPSRARYPDADGYVERDGVRVFYEVYGDGAPTILLLPTWTLLDSRIWKAQIPYFARHHRVVVFDPRGSGHSDRPRGANAYAEREFARDALDVMDATGTERAVVVGPSRGAQRALLLAADHPERVIGAAFTGPLFPVSPVSGLLWRAGVSSRLRLFTRRLPTSRGWAKFNAAHWRRDYRDFLEWFVARCTTQRHSTRAFEQGLEWGLETDPETLICSWLGELAAPPTRRGQLALARRVRCPVLVIHGTRDRLTSFADGRALARATGGRLVAISGGDHAVAGRRPVEVNLALREFVESLEATTAQPTGASAAEAPAALAAGSPRRESP